MTLAGELRLVVAATVLVLVLVLMLVLVLKKELLSLNTEVLLLLLFLLGLCLRPKATPALISTMMSAMAPTMRDMPFFEK